MCRLKQILGVVVSTFAIFFLFPYTTAAVSFPASYDVVYDIQEDGNVHVTQNIQLINETDTQYPSQYTLALSGVDVENIAAYDEKGPLAVTLEQVGGNQLVTVTFNVVAFGRGKTLDWVLEFDASNIAQQQGRMWEVTLPLVERDASIREYTIQVNVAAALGDLDYSDPLPDDYTRTTETRSLYYSFIDVDDITVVMAFGDFQIVNTVLDYHLENTQSEAVLAEIALPPTIPGYQKVYIESLQPEPFGMYQDSDGNVIAQYQLERGQRLDVVFDGQVVVSQRTLDEIPNSPRITLDTLYLSEDVFWETNAPELQAEVRAIKAGLGDDADAFSFIRAVFEYVTETLTYDTKRFEDLDGLDREGALFALQQPDQAICTDYTDLTIALLRAGGVSAREVNGYAFTGAEEDLPTISDVLHAWVQVYIPEKGWIFIDPTWTSTSRLNFFDRFDTNHVAFVVKGERSQYPYPAGSYKIKDKDSDDVFVEFTDTFASDITPLNQYVVNWQEEHSVLDSIDYLFRKVLEIYDRATS